MQFVNHVIKALNSDRGVMVNIVAGASAAATVVVLRGTMRTIMSYRDWRKETEKKLEDYEKRLWHLDFIEKYQRDQKPWEDMNRQAEIRRIVDETIKEERA